MFAVNSCMIDRNSNSAGEATSPQKFTLSISAYCVVIKKQRNCEGEEVGNLD